MTGAYRSGLDLVADVATTAGHLAVLSVVRPDLRIHASLVSAGLLDDPATGQPVVAAVVIGAARKLRYLRTSGRGCFVFTHSFRWVAVEGPVRLQGPDDPASGVEADTASLIRSVFLAAGGTHDDWGEFDRVMAEDRRCAVLLSPRSISTNS
jgi:hypothetical protein